jgi:hypothetical protein
MIRRNTSKGGWELLYKGLAVELENAGIDVSHGKTNAVKEFLAVKDNGFFKKIEDERLKKEAKDRERVVERAQLEIE